MAKKIKLRDKTGEQLIPVTRSTTVEMNDGVTLQTAYEGINSSHYTKAEINEMGYLQNYTEYDPTVPSYVKGITENDITNWNNTISKYVFTVEVVGSQAISEENYQSLSTRISNGEIVEAHDIVLGTPSAAGDIYYLQSYNFSGRDYISFINAKGNKIITFNDHGTPTVTSIQYITPAQLSAKSYITSEQLNNASYVSKSELNTASYISSSSLNTTLASYVTSGYYDTTTRKIYLRHGTNVLSEIDANDFIKDGMVDTAYVQGSYLVISFNTDAGKQPVEVPIADIFNPTNYYTKTEINNAGYLTSHQDLSSYVSKTELNAAGYLTSHQDIKTINGNTITGTGDVTISGLPEVNSTYNGKILQVVDGVWTLVTPLNLYSGTGTPNNTQGNNGDLYMQI